MSFIGNVPAESYSPVAKDTFSGNDSTTDFTLSIPATTNSVEVFVENVQQEPTTAYTISGTTLSFTAAPVTGTNNIYVIHRGPAVQQVTPPAGVAIDASTITGTGDMNIDSGTLFVDASTNRVGVGTTSPSHSITVNEGDALIRAATGSGTLNIISKQNLTNAGNKIAFFGADRFDTDEEMAFIQPLLTSNSGGSGNIQTGHLTFGTSGSERMRIGANGNLEFNSGYGSVATAYGCRAWVNFNGTGTVAIRQSGNVSSITDGGTGYYRVNFTNAMPDTGYSSVVSGTGGQTSGGYATHDSRSWGGGGTNLGAVAYFNIRTVEGGTSNATDHEWVTAAVFR